MKKTKMKLITILAVATLLLSMVFLTACGGGMPRLVSNPNRDPDAQVQAMKDAGWDVSYWDDRDDPIDGVIFEIEAERWSMTEEQLDALYDDEDNWYDDEFIWNGRVWMEFAFIVYFYSEEYAREAYTEMREEEERYIDMIIDELPDGVNVSWNVVRRGAIVSAWSRIEANYQDMSWFW
ncbi:MAG: hypothetical protein FWE13_03280 [Firmicutes bacterium]|nr:hypothetical protein [Bacillota bacterium]